MFWNKRHFRRLPVAKNLPRINGFMYNAMLC